MGAELYKKIGGTGIITEGTTGNTYGTFANFSNASSLVQLSAMVGAYSIRTDIDGVAVHIPCFLA